jgi:protein-S-isoprenylcysteine O-methyltransferase Ste14
MVIPEEEEMKFMRMNPPAYLLLGLALIVFFHYFIPGTKIIIFPWNLLGIIPLVLGMVINLLADRSFKKDKTTVKPLDPSTALITTGVFRLSRHPMYLGFVLILLGVALLMGSLTPHAVVAGFAVFLDRVFIVFEENKLEETFGDTWLEYKKRVHRWI